jgi:dephospho-CoA kinase
MAIVLVTGNPGSGKTELARALSRLGHAALDADEIAHWETQAGVVADRPEHLTAEWLAGHRWVWGRATLAAAIAKHAPAEGHLFLCGIAMDQLELADLIDMVFLLSLDDETQRQRLDTAANADRNADQRAEIIDGQPVLEQQLRAAGAVVLHARQPSLVLAERILHEVGQRFSLSPSATGDA